MAAPTGTQPRAAPLAPGTEAPDFELPSTPDQKLSLSDFRGRPVILVFYPADWSPVCGDQMALYKELLPEFQRYDAAARRRSRSTASGATSPSRKDRNLHFPLLADFEPKGEVARAYGVYRDGDGTSERALFVIDARRRRSAGATSRRSGSTPAPTASSARSRSWRRGGDGMSTTQWEAALTAAGQRRSATTSRGRVDAPVTLVEYGDYECPYCGAAYPIVKEVQARMGERLRFVFRNFPISTSHPHAEQRRRGGRGGRRPGAVLGDARPPLRAPAGSWTTRPRTATRRSSGSTSSGSTRSWPSTSTPTRVREDFMSGVRSGVNGTPTFYINGVRHDDSYDVDTLLGALQRAHSLTDGLAGRTARLHGCVLEPARNL